MGIPEKLDSAHIVCTLGLWAPECLKSGRLDSGCLVLGKFDVWALVAWTPKMYCQRYRNFTIKGTVR